MDEYTTHVEDRMRLRHGAQIRFTLKTGRKVIEDRLVPVMDIGGAITVASVMYNGLAMSGGTAWQHPEDGRSLETPKYRLRVRSQDVLSGDRECDCHACLTS